VSGAEGKGQNDCSPTLKKTFSVKKKRNQYSSGHFMACALHFTKKQNSLFRGVVFVCVCAFFVPSFFCFYDNIPIYNKKLENGKNTISGRILLVPFCHFREPVGTTLIQRFSLVITKVHFN